MELVELGRNICNVRRSLDMTQEEVALELDISITAYAKIERGETNVSFLRLTQIADLFNVPLSKLTRCFFSDARSCVPTFEEISYLLLDI